MVTTTLQRQSIALMMKSETPKYLRTAPAPLDLKHSFPSDHQMSCQCRGSEGWLEMKSCGGLAIIGKQAY